MILSTKEKYEFVPLFEGNDKAPASERVVCEIIRPTPDEVDELSDLELVREFSKREVAEAKDAKKGVEDKPKKSAIRFIRKQDTGRILREHVGSIRNLSEDIVGADGKKVRRAISSGADLAECRAFGIKGLIDELCAEVLRDKLTEEAEKNSESAPSST